MTTLTVATFTWFTTYFFLSNIFIIIEWQQGKAGKLLLNDIDNTSDRNNGLVCLNTLKHYMVQDDSKMALMYKQHDDDDVYGK